MIAVDVMSGENPPEEIINGALRAASEFNIKIAFVGDQDHIENCLKKIKGSEPQGIKNISRE